MLGRAFWARINYIYNCIYAIIREWTMVIPLELGYNVSWWRGIKLQGSLMLKVGICFWRLMQSTYIQYSAISSPLVRVSYIGAEIVHVLRENSPGNIIYFESCDSEKMSWFLWSKSYRFRVSSVTNKMNGEVTAFCEIRGGSERNFAQLLDENCKWYPESELSCHSWKPHFNFVITS